jgi:hypothetical protein
MTVLGVSAQAGQGPCPDWGWGPGLAGGDGPRENVCLLFDNSPRHGAIVFQPQNFAVGCHGIHFARVQESSPLVELHEASGKRGPVIDWLPSGSQSIVWFVRRNCHSPSPYGYLLLQRCRVLALYRV